MNNLVKNTAKNIAKNTATALSIALMMFVTSFQAMADDTEIFFSSQRANADTKPNVLMVLDTSGSMKDIVADGDPNGERSRLAHMQQAMHTILDNVNNINVGIMRFHDRGGPVLFPVADINANVADVLNDATIRTFNRITSANDDVEQRVATSPDPDADHPDFDADNDELTIGTKEFPVGDVDCGSDFTTKVEYRVNNANDDVEEDRSNTINRGRIFPNNHTLNLGVGRTVPPPAKNVGLRFNSIDIPKNAVIVCAFLDFRISRPSVRTGDFAIHIQNTDNAPAFANSDNNVSNRIAADSSSVAWGDPGRPGSGSLLTTPDIGSLVQGVVNRDGWTRNNSMAFIIDGSGNQTVTSHNNDASNAPLLRIEYAFKSERQYVGLRFTDVKVPKNAMVTAAYIDFTAVDGATYDNTANMEFSMEKADDSAAFDTSPTSTDVSERRGDAPHPTERWDNVPPWEPGKVYTTPDLKDLVQDIVNRNDWCGENDMTFIVNATGTRKAVSYDKYQIRAPALRIVYTESDTALGCGLSTIQSQIKTSTDDGMQSSSQLIPRATFLRVRNGATIGLRFQDVNVSDEDIIVSAELEFTVFDGADGGADQTGDYTIYGELQGDSQPFSNAAKIKTRTKTSAKVDWSPELWTTPGRSHATPDISAIVAEIVAHSGWSALNSMSFIIEGDSSSNRYITAYDQSPIQAPKLRINIRSQAPKVSVRQQLKYIVDGLPAGGFTPIVDTLYEAGAYYRGDEVVFGRTRGGGYDLDAIENPPTISYFASIQRQYDKSFNTTQLSHEASYRGAEPIREGDCSADNPAHADCRTERIAGSANYISPIKDECQGNHIVLLSDGEPSFMSLDQEVPGTPYFGAMRHCSASTSTYSGYNTTINGCVAEGSEYDCGRCGEEIVGYLQADDQIDNDVLAGDQTITTHTIGFNFSGSTYLQDLGRVGGGGFYEASTASQLADVFNTIFSDALQAPTSFVAPTVSVNTFNRLSHRDELYFALFEPSDMPRWAGNLKRYRLDTSGSAPMVVDALDNPAVSEVSGGFVTEARSWWSSETDGEAIRKGGFAGKIGTARRLFTFIHGHGSLSLSNSHNHLKHSNPLLTDEMLNIVTEQAADPGFRENLLNWIGGVDVNDENGNGSSTDARKFMGDPLHSRPVIVTYGGDAQAVADSVAFFGTNEGFIHAVDVANGNEHFSFMPPELLPKIKLLYANEGIPSEHFYGMDGVITPWVKDVNHNSILSDPGDHVFIYTGMRRGGSNYYALNVTNRTNPILQWTIRGGTGDFAELGQSWSQPIKSKVRIRVNNRPAAIRDVLIFSGGYDENQDHSTTPQVDNIGRALYIVDALSGQRLWWAGPVGSGADLEVPGLDNSMPATPAVVDLNVDGMADHVYIGDTGGKIWRFDFNQGHDRNHFTGSATLLATLGNVNALGETITSSTGDADADMANALKNNRRFYHTPSVALKSPLSSQTLYVAIGSGFHAHPLSQDVHDRFYVIEDSHVFNSSTMSLPLTEASLYDATGNLIQDGEDEERLEANNVRNSSHGWYLRLEEDSDTQIGEKVMSSASIFAGIVFVSTYLPEDPSVTEEVAICSTSIGIGRIYAMDLNNAGSVFAFDSSTTGLDKNDRFAQLRHVGIPPGLQIIIPDVSSHYKKPVLLMGAETVNDKIDESDPEGDGGNFFKNFEADITYWSTEQ